MVCIGMVVISRNIFKIQKCWMITKEDQVFNDLPEQERTLYLEAHFFPKALQIHPDSSFCFY